MSRHACVHGLGWSVHLNQAHLNPWLLCRSEPSPPQPLKAAKHKASVVFLDHTVQLRHSPRTHTQTPMNTYTQTLTLWARAKLQQLMSHFNHFRTSSRIQWLIYNMQIKDNIYSNNDNVILVISQHIRKLVETRQQHSPTLTSHHQSIANSKIIK